MYRNLTINPAQGFTKVPYTVTDTPGDWSEPTFTEETFLGFWERQSFAPFAKCGEGMTGNPLMTTFEAVKRVLTFVTFVAITMSVGACASHPKKHKKLKPGKEIPCPLKDC